MRSRIPNSAASAKRPHRRNERGVALIVSILMLVLMGMIGLSSLDTVMRDRQVAGYSSRARSALYAADAGVAAALDLLRTSATPAALSPGDCLTTALPVTPLPNGTSFRLDPTATNNLCMVSSAEPCAEFDASLEIGGSVFLYTVWDMRLQGQTPDGAIARVQATASRCHAFN